ncbi:MAG: hypothetical protein PCFJNLEI_03305 [Verrucomicrobiae bacterium]|nr:hypothetical protein [Verrucomicrobiae bacterium]
MDSSRELIRNLFSILLVACAAIGAASGMAELSIFRHLRELTAATRRLSAGNLTTRARLQDAPSEWRELAKEFDAMAASLEQRTRERDHVEQMLRAAEARLTAAIESLPFEFWLADLEARIVTQNATSLRRWGNLIGKRPAESGLSVDVVRTWQRNYRRALAGEIVTREVRDEEAGRHYHNIIAPVLMDGRPTGVLGVSIDTTDHRRAEETLRALTRRLRAVREEESTRIARAVHDDLGQAMTALKFDLAWCRQQVTAPAVTDKLITMTRTVDATLQTVRRIAAELRPGVLDNLGLVAAIEWQAQDFQRRTGIACHTNLPEAPLNLEPARATAVFRIFQEALTNVARHSQASEVGVALVQANNHVILEVADNGIGLRTDPWQDAHSLGLLGMRERARSLQGDVTVSPGPIHGTVVCVSLPTKESPHHREFAL